MFWRLWPHVRLRQGVALQSLKTLRFRSLGNMAGPFDFDQLSSSQMRRQCRFTLTDVLSLTAIIMLIVVCRAAATHDAFKKNPFSHRLTNHGHLNSHNPACPKDVRHREVVGGTK